MVVGISKMCCSRESCAKRDHTTHKLNYTVDDFENDFGDVWFVWRGLIRRHIFVA